MRKFILNLKRGDACAGTKVEGEFEDLEVVRLRQFLEHANEMKKLSLLQTGDFGKMKITQSRGGCSPNFEVSLPSEEAIAALLHKLRRFILHREPTSFNNIAALLKRRFRYPDIHSFIDQQRELFDGRTAQTQLKVISGAVVVNSDDTLTRWLNSCGEYHEDSDGRKELDELTEVLPDDATKYLLLTVLNDKVCAIIEIANFIALMLGEMNQ